MTKYWLAKRLTLLCCVGLSACVCVSATAQLKLLSEHPGTRPPELDRSWPAIMTHTHNWRFPAGEKPDSFPLAEQQLVEWSRKMGIQAIGVGAHHFKFRAIASLT